MAVAKPSPSNAAAVVPTERAENSRRETEKPASVKDWDFCEKRDFYRQKHLISKGRKKHAVFALDYYRTRDAGLCPTAGRPDLHAHDLCAQLGAQCGPASDGCGGTLMCGSCLAGQTCTAGKCASACTPETCAQQGLVCGAASNGCGGTLNCGTCAKGTICTAGQCVKK